MREQLRSLWKLQQLDIEIAQLELQKESIPQKIQQTSQKIKLKEEELQGKHEKNNTFFTQRRRLEQDIEEARDRIRRYKTQLLQVKTNREYQALLHEINTEETKISAYEEESFEMLAESEELSHEIEKMSTELGKKREKFDKYKKELEEEFTRVGNTLRIKQEKRMSLTEKLDRMFLAKYEQVKKGRSGIGVVEISESTCTGCNTIIPPQFISEIRAGNKILTCEQCGRILVWRELVE